MMVRLRGGSFRTVKQEFTFSSRPSIVGQVYYLLSRGVMFTSVHYHVIVYAMLDVVLIAYLVFQILVCCRFIRYAL